MLGRSRADGSAPSTCRVEQLYQKVMALWHQLHMNTKSLISWNYLRKDIALVQSFSMEKVWRNLPAWFWGCAALQASLCGRGERKTRQFRIGEVKGLYTWNSVHLEKGHRLRLWGAAGEKGSNLHLENLSLGVLCKGIAAFPN